jgi:hypothetical protein
MGMQKGQLHGGSTCVQLRGVQRTATVCLFVIICVKGSCQHLSAAVVLLCTMQHGRVGSGGGVVQHSSQYHRFTAAQFTRDDPCDTCDVWLHRCVVPGAAVSGVHAVCVSGQPYDCG